MRNTLILIGQIHDNERAGLNLFEAVVEATVQRSRPVILTALAAVLAFVPLISSVFWGVVAVTLIGGTLGGGGGTILTLLFLPALCALVRHKATRRRGAIGNALSPRDGLLEQPILFFHGARRTGGEEDRPTIVVRRRPGCRHTAFGLRSEIVRPHQK
ncbi:efflux RND transporter permease subunit [Rhizorhabdus argentea]|uniref:efflux RND transporter permease subunit n=1 Tax=Rhizorhabdus argentea TaxID=1387174 RepID=UPI0030ED47B2